MRHREAAARSLAMQRQQLLPKSEVLKGEILARSEADENPAKKMPQESDHAQNLNGNTRTATLSKYLILRIRQVLRRHNARDISPNQLQSGAKRNARKLIMAAGAALMYSAFQHASQRPNWWRSRGCASSRMVDATLVAGPS